MINLSNKERERNKNEIRRAYVERQIIPWLTGHLQMRNTGLQVFTAVQGALMVAYSSSQFIPIAILGLASALAAILWDSRNRDVFQRLHSMAEQLSDREVFGTEPSGFAIDGLHRQAQGTLSQSGKLSFGSGLRSHTWAIRIVVSTSALVWVSLVFTRFCPTWF